MRRSADRHLHKWLLHPPRAYLRLRSGTGQSKEAYLSKPKPASIQRYRGAGARGYESTGVRRWKLQAFNYFVGFLRCFESSSFGPSCATEAALVAFLPSWSRAFNRAI